MGTRKTARTRIEWAAWLIAGIAVWAAGALWVSYYLTGCRTVDLSACKASCAYLLVLLIVMGIGNFARVRALLTLEILYGVAVIFRSVVGILTALLLIEQPLSIDARWSALFDAAVRPLAGLEYAAAQLTSHFVTEIYWLGLGLSATILVFLSCIAIMAVGSRIGRERERAQRRRQNGTAEKAASEAKKEPPKTALAAKKDEK